MDGALGEWRELLGERATVAPDAYGRNLTEFAARSLTAVLRPISREEVQAIVAVAARHRVPLYPVSAGRNWGLGSRLPVRDGCALVDLGLMNRILAVDEELHYAVVEPGVTQRQLADALAGGPCMLNVTGSAEHTSVVGNTLERGVGMLGLRTRDLRALEAVLGTGEVVRTGHWAAEGSGGPDWHHHPDGLGPDVTGLFAQSAFGIVTAAVIGLHPRQEYELALVNAPDDALAGHVDALRRLRQMDAFVDRIEVNSADDPRLIGIRDGARTAAWATWAAVRASEKAVLAAWKDRIAAAFGDVEFFGAADPSLPEPARTRLRKLSGEPGDEYVDAMAGRPVDTRGAFALDDDPAFPGFVCALPAVPFAGAHVTAIVAAARRIDADTGVHTHLTFNSVSAHSMEGFFRVMFDRADPAQVATAHAWSARAQREFAALGYRPMRTGVDTMAYANGHTAMLRAIKHALDPASLMSPGRYIAS